MDLDHPAFLMVNPTNQPSPPDASQASDVLLEELTFVLAELETRSKDVPLLQRQVRLLGDLGLKDEVLTTILRLANLIMLPERESRSVSLSPC